MSQRLTSHLRAVVNDIQAEGQWEDGAAVMFNELKRPDLILCTGYLHPRESYINEEGKRVTRKVVTPDWVLESLRKRMREITAPVEVGAIEKAISPVYRIADFATLVEKAIALFVGKWVGSEGNWLSNRHHWGSKRALILKSVNNVFFHSGATRLAPVEELNELISEQVGHFVANPVRWMGEEADLRSSGRKDVVLKQVGKDLADEMEDTCAKILYGKAMMPKWAKAVATDSESFGKGCSAERHRQMNEAFGVALSKCRNSLLRGVHTGLEVRSEVLDDTDKVLSMKQD
jgi:hypothetical protein